MTLMNTPNRTIKYLKNFSKWRADIWFWNVEHKYLGLFNTEEEAIDAYDKANEEFKKEFLRLKPN